MPGHFRSIGRLERYVPLFFRSGSVIGAYNYFGTTYNLNGCSVEQQSNGETNYEE